MKMLKENLVLYAWIVAIAAMAGSLYFSEVLNFAPCVLCWYQRICMYSLVAVLSVGIAVKDRFVWRYGLPLSIIGLAIAIYQNLLYYGVISESVAPCRFGVSCTTQYINWLGFIGIPFLSMLAFIVITALLWGYRNINKNV
ncbi:MAG TPA: disulfide oxidoreductase [Candidatus Paceibacterota bacterium]|nr:disulfide oxidoreductase [Candidatus Paceibacterota bacterium]